MSISVGGFFPDLNWRLAYYSNPRPQLAIASGIALIWFLWRRDKIMSGISTLPLLINLFVLMPLFVSPPTFPVSTPTLTIAHLNTNRGQAALTELHDLSVDILLLQEFTPKLADTLPDLFPAYTLIHSHPLTNTHGSALLVHQASPVEIIETEVIHLPADSTRPLIAADVKFGNKVIKLLSLHVIRPRNQWTDRYQKIELEAVAAWSRAVQQDTGQDVAIVGDFNATPWSNRFHQLLNEGLLIDSLRGYGLQNTWPSHIPRFLGIPIDHAVHSIGLTTVDRTTTVVKSADHTLLQITLGQQATS